MTEGRLGDILDSGRHSYARVCKEGPWTGSGGETAGGVLYMLGGCRGERVSLEVYGGLLAERTGDSEISGGRTASPERP